MSRRMKTTKTTVSEYNKRLKARGNGHCYDSRDAHLRTLGFLSYRQYVKSKFYNDIRLRVFKEKGRWCLTCPNTANEIHHNRYNLADLSGRTLEFLVPICRPCHDCIEHDEYGKKVSVSQAFANWRRLRRAYTVLVEHLTKE